MPTEKQRDAYLRRKFGRDLVWYNQTLFNQGGVCAICKRPPVKYSLAVDHNHKFDRIKITMSRVTGYGVGIKDHPFYGCALVPNGPVVAESGTDRKKIRRAIKLKLRALSCRGLLCMGCNKGLAYYRDLPERMDAAAEYLRKYA